MPNNDEKKQGFAFDEDTQREFTLPKATPELNQDAEPDPDDPGSDAKRADSAIDDLEIEVDEEELNAESESPGRKY